MVKFYWKSKTILSYNSCDGVVTKVCCVATAAIPRELIDMTMKFVYDLNASFDRYGVFMDDITVTCDGDSPVANIVINLRYHHVHSITIPEMIDTVLEQYALRIDPRCAHE